MSMYTFIHTGRHKPAVFTCHCVVLFLINNECIFSKKGEKGLTP